MPRRKQLTFKIKDLRCAQYLIAELSQLPQLANFDMTSIEISIKENRPAPKIIKKDMRCTDRPLATWILRKQTYSYPTERKIFGDKHSFSQMDENHPASVNKWIKDGLIKPCQDPHVCFDYFNVDEVTKQLQAKTIKSHFNLSSYIKSAI